MNISSDKYLGKIFTIFDKTIRFLYCRFPFRRLFFWKIYSSKPEVQWLRFKQMNDMCKKNNLDIKNMKFLELGPGNSRVIALFLIRKGAKEVYQLDKFNRRMKTRRQIKYKKNEEMFVYEKINNIYKEKFQKQLNNDNLKYIVGDLENIYLKETFDFIFSVSVLEHVRNVENFIKAMRNSIKSGGFMWHHIDFRDHYNFSTPFLFYKYNNEYWNKWLVKEGVSYTNRLRIDEFRKLFINNGFIIVSENLIREELPSSQKISYPFSEMSLENLKITQADILLKTR